MKRIAINENGIHMVFEVRRDKVRLVHFSALPLDENTLVRQGEKDRVYEAVCALDRKQKTVVIFYYYQQLTTREIADILGCMEGTVKSRLHTARKKLSKALEDLGWQEEEKIWTKKNWNL